MTGRVPFFVSEMYEARHAKKSFFSVLQLVLGAWTGEGGAGGAGGLRMGTWYYVFS